jgi:hypothetical protein
MSGMFELRAVSFETGFAIGEELRFKALARRNRALGLWAAQLLGHQGELAKAEADALVEDQIERGDDRALAAELGAKFSSAGVGISRHRIRRMMEQKMAEALAGVRAGY